jgi:hypothetical protein
MAMVTGCQPRAMDFRCLVKLRVEAGWEKVMGCLA